MLSRTPSPTSSSSSPHPVFSEKAIADDKLQFQASDDKDKDQQVYQNETLKGLQQDDHIRAALTVGKDAAFLIKVDLLNQEISRIGMGRFQWGLFWVSGMGWAVDNLYLQGVALVLSSVQQEFSINNVALSTLYLYVGLFFGALFWGISADVVGRRFSWNSTLLLSGVIGVAAGGVQSFNSWCGVVALLGFAVGGNLPVDGALFLEFMPSNRQWLLTLLSAFWAFGLVIGSLIVWPFVKYYSCPTTLDEATGNLYCSPGTLGQNWGWRYSMFTMGAITLACFAIRLVAFPLTESPKWLVSKGRDEEAIAVLNTVAKMNKTECLLTVEDLRDACLRMDVDPKQAAAASFAVTMRRTFSNVNGNHISAIFRGKRLAINTSIIILLWALIGLAYPLYNAFLPLLLAKLTTTVGNDSLDIAYRNYAIQAACGVPGSILGAFLVEWRVTGAWAFISGRRGALAFSTITTSIFLFAFTTAKSNNVILVWNCLASFVQNAMYAVLYGYTPEVFSSEDRGTGDALCSAANRLFGIIAPIIKLYGSPTVFAPVYTAAGLFMGAGVLAFFLPLETAGQAAL